MTQVKSKSILNIALIGEGRNDVGVMGEKDWNEGTMQAYLNQLLGDEFILNFLPISVSKQETKGIKSLKGGRYRKYKIRGVAKKLFRFVQLHGKKESLHLVVFFSDTDKTTGERATEKEALSKYASVMENIAEGQRLIKDEMPNLAFIPMVPIRILECWLLGDAQGFNYIGCTPQNPILPQTPELIWGDQNDPESDYPKHYLKRVLENGGFSSDTDTFCNVIRNNNFDKLNTNCPLSFPRFYDAVMDYREGILEQIDNSET
jgi:hypothetical protein